jgi:hypothetical protein
MPIDPLPVSPNQIDSDSMRTKINELISDNSSVTVGNVPPTSPEEGYLWFDVDNTATYVYVGDPTNAWVQANSSTGSSAPEDQEYLTGDRHSTNPKNVAGYGCLWNADLAWKVYHLDGILYIAIGTGSNVNHGNGDPNSLTMATEQSIKNHYDSNNQTASVFVEITRFPLTEADEWIYGTRDRVIWPSSISYFSSSRWAIWFGQGHHKYGQGYDPSNEYDTRWMVAARWNGGSSISVALNPVRYGTGDDGSSMSVAAMGCAFNIIAGRPNGTAITPYTFDYE